MPPRRRRSLPGRFLRALASGMLLLWLVSGAAVLLWSRADRARPADAIIVLGAAQYGGRPSPVLRSRLDHAIGLWHGGLAPRLVVTGGVGAGDTTSEAAVGRRYAIRQGIPDSAILVESHGRTTMESMKAAALLMDGYGLDSAILVSDPFHMLRLDILARQQGLHPFTSPTRTSPISANRRQWWGYVVSESVKVPLTLLLGQVNGNGKGGQRDDGEAQVAR
jgi:uncharacterized SAM-binding protein YcdF (DUF218 family)